MVAFAAVIARGQTNLLPSSRLEAELADIASDYPESYCLRDAAIRDWISDSDVGCSHAVPEISFDHVAAIVFTSGSTGRARPNVKYWRHLIATTCLAQRRFGFDSHATLVATVPPQHMYGLETSILLPLIAGVGVHGGRPFFPEDIRAALQTVPAPRVLITTPAHIRVCVESGIDWPELDFMISATAPLSKTLAAQAEQIFKTRVLEIYGSTETGSMASRRTLDGDLWHLYDDMWINPETGCVEAPHLLAATALHDHIELQGDRHFKLLGRHADFVNIAGKRAYLSDLNQRLNEIEGVQDGVFIMPDSTTDQVVRLAALVVAPGLSEQALSAALARHIDAAFLPRPLCKVECLPRNETGKLPRRELLALLARRQAGGL